VPEIHQSFGHQNISVLRDGRLDVIHRTAIEDSMYEPEADYRTEAL
jgi:branched-chain amino acid transport system substrate-binding protein